MMPSVRQTLLAFATAYLRLLESLNDRYREGGDTREEAIAAFFLHRAQFGHVVETLECFRQSDEELARIVMRFSRVGGAIMNLCLSPDERLRWSSAALDAATYLQNPGYIARNSNDLGVAHLATADFDAARVHLERALRIATDLGDTEAIGSALGNLGNLEIRRNQPREAISHLERALEIFRASGSRRYPEALNSLGVAYSDAGRLDQAVARLLEAEEVCRAAADVRGEARALNNRGIALRRMGRVDEATELYERARTLFAAAHDASGESDAIANLSLLLEAIDLPRAEKLAEEALALRIQHALGDTVVLIERLRRFRERQHIPAQRRED